MDELINQFNINNIQKAGAVFDTDKLNWMNGQYLKRADVKSILQLSRDIFHKNDFIIKNESDFIEILEFAKLRSDSISDMAIQSTPFFIDPKYNLEYIDSILDAKSRTLFSLLINKIDILDVINASDVKEIISNLSIDLKLKGN